MTESRWASKLKLHRTPTSRRALFWLSLLGFVLMSSAWALATPLTAVPDEASHIIKAEAVARGDLLPMPGSAVDRPLFTVSAAAGSIWEQACFLYDPTLDRECSPEIPSGSAVFQGATGAGFNNPVYYALVGWATLVFPSAFGLYVMRFASALLCSILLASTFSALPGMRMPYFAGLGLGIAATPMMMFLQGSVNPNGLEVAAAAALFVNLAAYLRRPSRRSAWSSGLWVAISAVFLMNSRSVSPFWAAILVATAFVFATRRTWAVVLRRPATWVAAIVTALSAAAAAAWLMFASPLQPAGAPYAGFELSPTAAFFLMISRTVDYGRGLIGFFGPDHVVAPDLVLFAWGALVLAMVVAALFLGRGRARWAAGILAAALVLGPAFVQASGTSSFGIIWQGRYVLVLLIPVLVAAGIALGDTTSNRTSRHYAHGVRTVAMVLSGMHLIAFLHLVKGYEVGSNGSWGEFVTDGMLGLPLVWTGILALGLLIFWTAVSRLALATMEAGEPLSRADPRN